MRIIAGHLAEAALEYRRSGLSVFPVGRDKRPLVEWRDFQKDPPHLDHVSIWWERWPDANIGLATGAVSGVIVLDADEAEGLASLEALNLPDLSWRSRTGRGLHDFRKHPGVPIHNRAGLRPGLDVRGDGGFVIVPPSVHASGRRYEWIHDPTDTPLAPLPPALLALLREPPSNGGPAKASAEIIPEGQRQETLYRLARAMLARGLSPEAMTAALLEENRTRCRPPLPGAEVHATARHAATQPHRADFGQRPIPAPAPDLAQPLSVPEAGLIGVGREFADLYAHYLESPRAFFYFTFLTYFGALVARKITLDSELRPQPRLYVVLVGESADTRKTTALRKVDEFFRSLGPGLEPHVLFGVGSAEGIAAELEDSPDLILHFDELKAFVDKAKNEHSVALPMVSTLFERPDYDNRTKAEKLSVRNAAVSLVAACTADTYATIFDQKFLAIGFPNRLFLVSDRSTARIAVPTMIPGAALDTLRGRVRGLLETLDAAYEANGRRPVPYRLTSGALDLFRRWYAGREGSIFERRLDTYGHRLLILLAATSGRSVIDEDLTERVLALLRYQLDVRRECDPVDAENVVAAMEERLRRILARGALKSRDLKRKVHYNRTGLWVWNTAIENLRRAREITHDPKLDLFWLAPGVTTSVTTSKRDLTTDEHLQKEKKGGV